MVPFSSHSHSLAIKLSLKSHKMIMISLKLLFWTKQVVIWWLFNDDLSAREWEREEKNRNFSPKQYVACIPCWLPPPQHATPRCSHWLQQWIGVLHLWSQVRHCTRFNFSLDLIISKHFVVQWRWQLRRRRRRGVRRLWSRVSRRTKLRANTLLL